MSTAAHGSHPLLSLFAPRHGTLTHNTLGTQAILPPPPVQGRDPQCTVHTCHPLLLHPSTPILHCSWPPPYLPLNCWLKGHLLKGLPDSSASLLSLTLLSQVTLKLSPIPRLPHIPLQVPINTTKLCGQLTDPGRTVNTQLGRPTGRRNLGQRGPRGSHPHM